MLKEETGIEWCEYSVDVGVDILVLESGACGGCEDILRDETIGGTK